MKFEKRGLSTVVATLIILLLSLIAIILIYGFVRNFIEYQSEVTDAKAKAILIDVAISKVEIDPSNPLEVVLTIQQRSGQSIVISTQAIPGSQPEADIFMLSDISNSMTLEKLDLSKNAHKLFINAIIPPNEQIRVGLVAFAKYIWDETKSIDHSNDLTREISDLEKAKNELELLNIKQSTNKNYPSRLYRAPTTAIYPTYKPLPTWAPLPTSSYKYEPYRYIPPTAIPTTTIDVYGNASSYTQYGNTVYGSDGSRYSKYGDTIYGNDGSRYSKYGDTIYGIDGSSCTRYGNSTYCR